MARWSVVLVVAAWASSASAQAPGVPADSLSFEQAVRAAEGASESMEVAHAEVDRSRALVSTARSGYLPTVSGNSSYQRTLASEFDDISFGGMTSGDGLGDLPFGQRNTWRLGLSASQPLFDGFRTRATVRQAKAGERGAELGVKSTRAQVVLQVAQQYFDTVLAQRQVEIAEVTLQQAEQTFKENELGYKAGATPEFDLVRAEVARDNQRTLLVGFQVQGGVALVSLRRLIGVPLDRPLTLTTTLDTDDVEAVTAAARAAAGIVPSTRVAVAQAQENVLAREAGVDVARADQLPTLIAGTDYGLVSYQNRPWNTDWRTNWTLGVTLSVPIFDGFRRRAQIANNRAQLASARAQLQFTHEVSQVEAEEARANVAASRTQLENSMRTVKQARRAYEIAELRFQQGASTHIELVDARVQLEQALLIQAKAARDLRVARLHEELLPGLPLRAAVTGL